MKTCELKLQKKMRMHHMMEEILELLQQPCVQS